MFTPYVAAFLLNEPDHKTVQQSNNAEYGDDPIGKFMAMGTENLIRAVWKYRASPKKVPDQLLVCGKGDLWSKVINLGSETFGKPIFQKGLQN